MENDISAYFLWEKLWGNSLTIICLSENCFADVATFLNAGDVKPYCLCRPTGSVTLFPHEVYIITDCIFRTAQIQLHEIENHIMNSTGSAFGAETLCRAVHKLGITRKKVSRHASNFVSYI